MPVVIQALAVTGLLFAGTRPAASLQPGFDTQILPIFRQSCAPCHGVSAPQARLRLDSLEGVLKGGISGPAIAPGNSRTSLLYQRIASADAKVRMPPVGAALPVEQIAGIAAWIDSVPSRTVAATKVDYARSVEPILRSSCYGCHSGTQPKSQLRLDIKSGAMQGGIGGAVIVPGSSERSRLIQRVEGRGGEARMPFNGTPLGPEQIATLKRWIDEGAEWPESAEARDQSPPKHWAYVKPVKPVPPRVKHAALVRNPIDNFILARLEQEGLTYSPEASKEKLARRVSLDLIGLPPSPAELDAFLADTRPDAYERLVDRLLASPHFGERWARPWLDLARYADSNGYEKDDRRDIWKYRDWVINALNRDMPFDEFAIEQIAGDMLPNATEDQRIATGFHRNTQFNEEGGVDKDESYFEVQVDRVATTATVWLGSTLGCAQCHNHKFDPFTQKDFYSMMAFFNNGEKSRRITGDVDLHRAGARDADSRTEGAARKARSANQGTGREDPDHDAGTESGASGVGKIGAGCGAGLARDHSGEDDERRGNHTYCGCAGADLRRAAKRRATKPT